MTQSFSCHVFAHKQGRYQTVYSHGTTPTETKALEQFFFGETNDSTYIGSLRAEPGVIWRRIGNQVALTRVRQGKKDANGRPTFSFETLLDSDRGTPLVGRVAETVLGEWDFRQSGVTVSFSAARAKMDLNPEGISEVLLAVRNGQRVLRRANAFSLRDVEKMIASCAEESGFSLCFKSLNDRAPVLVNLVSRNVSERNMPATPPVRTDPLPRAHRRIPESPPRASSNMLVLLAVCAALVIQTILFWRATDVPNNSESLDKMQSYIGDRSDNLEKSHASAMEELRKSLATDIRKVEDLSKTGFADAHHDLEKLAGAVEEQKKQLEHLKSEVLKQEKTSHSIQRTLKAISDSQDDSKSKIVSLQKYIDDLSGQIKEIERMLQKDYLAQDDESQGRTDEDSRRNQERDTQ